MESLCCRNKTGGMPPDTPSLALPFSGLAFSYNSRFRWLWVDAPFQNFLHAPLSGAPQTGADPASKFKGRGISVIFGGQVSLCIYSLLQERWSILHNIAVTKKWTTKWPYIANSTKSWWKSYFCRGDHPNRPPTWIHHPCAHTWPMPSLSRRSERRRHENILYNAIASTDKAQHKNCPSSGIDDRPGRDLFRVLKRSPVSQPHALGLRRGYSDGKTVGNTTGHRRRLHPHLENFPSTVIMPRAWPDWSKFQFLRSWHDPAEIRTTRTTTYQTWSERSNH